MNEDNYPCVRSAVERGVLTDTNNPFWDEVIKLLAERDALEKERDEGFWHSPYKSIFDKCEFGICVGTCDWVCGATTCPKMRTTLPG